MPILLFYIALVQALSFHSSSLIQCGKLALCILSGRIFLNIPFPHHSSFIVCLFFSELTCKWFFIVNFLYYFYLFDRVSGSHLQHSTSLLMQNISLIVCLLLYHLVQNQQATVLPSEYYSTLWRELFWLANSYDHSTPATATSQTFSYIHI